MATGVYSLKTLNDNWFEDRGQPAGTLAATGPLHESTARAYETDLAYIGERYDVLARISRVPNRPSYATPDDGFREKGTTHLGDFSDPKTRAGFTTKKSSAPRMIHTGNAPVMPPEQRELPGPQEGFGCALKRHESNHEQRFWATANGDFFGGEHSRKPRPRMEPSAGEHSGVSTEYEEKRPQGLRVGKLCGETFNESNDPSLNTRTQRAWLYQSDAALQNIHLGGTRPAAPTVDNHLSLPLGEGAMAKVRADLKERKGRLFRTATHITKGAGQRSGVSIFNDC